MFAELLPLIKERALTIHAVERDGKISLMIAPKKLKDDENAAHWTPFNVVGSAEELDAGLPQMLTQYVQVRIEITTSLVDQLKVAEETMKKAAEEAKKKAAEKAKKPTPKLGHPLPTSSKPVAAVGNANASTDDDDDDELPAPAAPAAVVAEEAPQVTLF